MNNSRRPIHSIYKLALASILSLVAATPNYADTLETRPNIIFILTDDLGFNQIGAYGDTPIQTPHLDKLASQGIRFTQAYSGNTVCSPSRVSLFTGRDGRLMENNSNTVQLRDIDVTIAHVLKYGGYDTALFGKYSIGEMPKDAHAKFPLSFMPKIIAFMLKGIISKKNSPSPFFSGKAPIVAVKQLP